MFDVKKCFVLRKFSCGFVSSKCILLFSIHVAFSLDFISILYANCLNSSPPGKQGQNDINIGVMS